MVAGTPGQFVRLTRLGTFPSVLMSHTKTRPNCLNPPAPCPFGPPLRCSGDTLSKIADPETEFLRFLNFDKDCIDSSVQLLGFKRFSYERETFAGKIASPHEDVCLALRRLSCPRRHDSHETDTVATSLAGVPWRGG